MSYRITLERNSLRFSAAHFTTSSSGCEPLHGHNYDVLVEIRGALSSDSWVLDFVEAKRIIAAICKELDHKFILALGSPRLRIVECEVEYEISFGDRRYVIPKADVAALPIDNSTAERLAEWLAGRIAAEVTAAGGANLEEISVGVEEAPGQAGWYTLALRPPRPRSKRATKQ